MIIMWIRTTGINKVISIIEPNWT